MKVQYTRTCVTSILKSVEISNKMLNDLHEMVKMFEQLQFEPQMASYPKLDKEITIDSLSSRLICHEYVKLSVTVLISIKGEYS